MTLISSSLAPGYDSGKLERLRLRISGQVIAPQDAGYDGARQPWNLTVDQRPRLIVVARTSTDIVEAVRFAAEQGLDVAVMAGGHGTIRPADDSLLIVISGLTEVRIDPAAQTAWIGGGVKWGRVLEQTQAVGLAPLLGSSPDVGAVGYTLGGGMGWLARKYGLSTDSVNCFELVTADGGLVNASATENPDLFWALRGGGGNFGIVTGMEIRLYPVTTVYGGNLIYPIEAAKDVYARYRDWITNAPDELTSSVVLMNFPPVPAVPEPLRGKSFAMVRGLYAGPVEEGETLLKHWRDWKTPLVDEFRAMPFSEVATVSKDPVDPLPAQSSGAWLKDLGDETAAVLIEYTVPRGGPPLLAFAEVRHAGGAISKVDPESAAYGNREALYSLQVIAPAPTPEIHAAVREHIARLKAALAGHLHGGVYLNFLEGPEARAAAAQGFSAETRRRLQEVKAKYDPQNRFSHSYSIAQTNE
jgi:FAD/FMN-containing dehydrogenase